MFPWMSASSSAISLRGLSASLPLDGRGHIGEGLPGRASVGRDGPP